jgi:glutathione synthase/RimK-type ligase-like ATP-grasp enzyme
VDTIGIYIPGWLYRADKTDRLFADELFHTIQKSGRYKALKITLPLLQLSTEEDAHAYVEKRHLVGIIEHHSSLYDSSAQYRKNVELLASQLFFLNSWQSQEIGYDKARTKQALREKGIPVLDDTIATTAEQVLSALEEKKWYVVKPLNKGAGAGVKLIRRKGELLFENRNGGWHHISIRQKTLKDGTPGIRLTRGLFSYYTYSPMLIEPYFNDDPQGFASLRCTVIGNEVVEAVKRVNARGITSNVSSGGKAYPITLTETQRKMAIDAKNAIGAEYAGVDLLVCEGRSVIGEVNIGPFTVFTKWTKAPVGKILAEHMMSICDQRKTAASTATT